ncbi:MAG: NusG domain II-containing protein [Coriobacteriia bacterium]|nr:NusG domain II-containing protein [Coriobacteriia bacterium]
MTRADLRLLVVLVLVTVLSVPAVTYAARGSDTVLVSGPAGRSQIPLSEPGRYVVPGAVGNVVFEVIAGQLVCVESDCPDQTCVREHVVRPGRPVVCAPNGVSAVMTSGNGREGGLDAVSR